MSSASPSTFNTEPMAVVFGCGGLVLNDDERAFFRETNPLGFILFARNVDTPDQVRALVDDLRATVGRENAPVLIDQEGGRVARLRPPHWDERPSAADIAAVYERAELEGIEAAQILGRLIGEDLNALGITVDCAPVLDLPQQGADPVIGDRAFGTQPRVVTALARAMCSGLLEGGVLPVIKHIPGHGRASVDSHKALPVVDASAAQLETYDFVPFENLREMPWAMTAHIVYQAFDTDRPATTSPVVIKDIIRKKIGFDGFLISDDLSMEALEGDYETRAHQCLDAGCDAVLHCNGKMDEMQAVARGARGITSAARLRLDSGERLRTRGRLAGKDLDALAAQLHALLAGERK